MKSNPSLITLLIFLIASLASPSFARPFVVGYAPNWRNADELADTIDYEKLTHLNIAFENPISVDGDLSFKDGNRALIAKAKAHNVRVLVSIGGGGAATDTTLQARYFDLISGPKREAFAIKIRDYLTTHDLDGIDVDIEGPSINEDYGDFIETLASVLKPKGLLLTAALSRGYGGDRVPESTFVHFDFLNIMAYDGTGPWSPDRPGQHSSFEFAKENVSYWLDRGLPKSKAVLGVPFYGYRFGGDYKGRSYSYRDIVDEFPGAEKLDEIGDKIWYNGIPTIQEKAKYVLEEGLGGIMIWSLNSDTTDDKSLLTAIHQVFSRTTASKKSNILLIAIDDLNDWIGVLGGHPQVQTPNIDRLASRGVLFTNAHCQSPVCNPSRASMMTSLYPATTGIYFLNPDLAESPVAQENVLLPKRFEQEGYLVSGAGKLFHGGQNNRYLPNYAGDFGGFGPMPEKKLSPFPGHPLWDWGVFPETDEEMPDHQIAAWTVEQLKELPENTFLLAAGFFRPHVPQYAPQKWFDLYPLESLQLPLTLQEDLDDLSPYAVNLTRLKHVSPSHDWVIENDEWKPLVQSYLACVSFVDHQIGKVIEAVDESSAKDNTYIVLYSDHGFHLGEKERWAKRSLWEDSTQVPLIIAGPGIHEGVKVTQPVQLLDIYPTLLELTGLEADSKHEGHSVVPLLKDAEAEWPHMARTNYGPGNDSVRSEHYRYIRYNDGSEELYHVTEDPHEWHNLVDQPAMAPILAQHRSSLPKDNHPILGEGSTGHETYEASEAQVPTE